MQFIAKFYGFSLVSLGKVRTFALAFGKQRPKHSS